MSFDDTQSILTELQAAEAELTALHRDQTYADAADRPGVLLQVRQHKAYMRELTDALKTAEAAQ